MIRILKSKLWTCIAMVVTLVLLLTGVIFTVRFYVSMDIYEKSPTLLEGSYSVDGGEWKEIRRDEAIDERFHSLELRGRFPNKLLIIFEEINEAYRGDDAYTYLGIIDKNRHLLKGSVIQ